MQLKHEDFYDYIHEQIIPYISNWELKNHILYRENDFEKIELILPLWLNEKTENISLKDYLLQIPPCLPDYLILLIQAGSAVIGQYEDGKLINHKVIKKYMIRASQGKAQLKHLNSKGKSKLGSRIRLAQTKGFFEEINEKIQEWETDYVPYIFYSASIDCWNLLFESKILPTFEKKDERLKKIPLLIHTPDFEELIKINNEISKAKKIITEKI